MLILKKIILRASVFSFILLFSMPSQATDMDSLTQAVQKSKTQALQELDDAERKEREFSQWVMTSLKKDALKYGISPVFLEQTLPKINYVPRVSKQQKVTEQPEFKDTFDQYFAKYSTSKGIEKGRNYYRQYKEFVDSLGTGIPASVPITLWWMESRFSEYLGNQNILDALATVYFERKKYPDQLLSALRNVELGLISADTEASWAGCIGGVQFNPDNYRKLTKDGNGDGVIDLFHTPEDILASAVNLLDQAGWHSGKEIGQLVSLPKTFDNRFASPRVSDPAPRPISFWRQLGVTNLDGSPLPDYPYEMSIYHVNTIDHPVSRAFLASPNFNILWKNWNKAYKFVITAAIISSLIENPEIPYNLESIKETRHDIQTSTSR